MYVRKRKLVYNLIWSLLQILKVLMRGVAHSLTVEEIGGVADSAHGFTGSDLRTVCLQGRPLSFY